MHKYTEATIFVKNQGFHYRSEDTKLSIEVSVGENSGLR
jgi:hypothetical protein